jgi:hypothetical protein
MFKMSFRMHDTTPAVNLQAMVSQPNPIQPSAPPTPQIDVVALQMQLIQLQQQMNQLTQKKEVAPNPMKINILQPTPTPISGLQLPQNEIVLIRSPCASPRVSPRRR